MKKLSIYNLLFEQESKIDDSEESNLILKNNKTKARKPLHSVDQQIDALILKYESSSIVEKGQENLKELSLRFLFEQDEEEDAGEEPAEDTDTASGGEEMKASKPGGELTPNLDIDEFANRCVRLIANHRSLLRIEEAIVNRIRKFLDDNYGDAHVKRFIETLEKDFGLETEEFRGVDPDSDPEVFAIGANPAGAGMSGGG